MNDDLVLYTNPMSRGRIARWMLEEVGRPYRAEILEYGTAMKATAYLGLNPMGKVPTLRHGGTVVTEVAAICTYLADAFPEAGLAPLLGSPLRGTFYRWMFFAAGPVEHAMTNKALGFIVPEERRGIAGYGSFDDVVTVLDGLVSQHEYALGASFSAVDVYLGSQIGWGMQFGTFPRLASFERYWERISARPAAVRSREIDDALVAEREAAKG
jgi:glutathione S-transferase